MRWAGGGRVVRLAERRAERRTVRRAVGCLCALSLGCRGRQWGSAVRGSVRMCECIVISVCGQAVGAARKSRDEIRLGKDRLGEESLN